MWVTETTPWSQPLLRQSSKITATARYESAKLFMASPPITPQQAADNSPGIAHVCKSCLGITISREVA
jgi:hypothetical protein